METHENDLPDDELPGAGMFTPEFIRDRIREQEEMGILLWDEENNTYQTSARGILVGIAMNVMGRAQSIDPRAEQDEIMHQVIQSLPWQASAVMLDSDEQMDDLENMRRLLDQDTPDAPPEGWGDGA